MDRRLLIVTGKGGTGKTTVAAALAKLAAKRNKRVLLCEIDATGEIGAPFGALQTSFEPVELETGVFVMSMDTELAMQEYLQLNMKLPLSLRVGPLAKAFDFVATAAPGVREVLTIGKLCWEVKRQNYDLVVVDAPASGHVVSQLESPDALGSLVSAGPLAKQTAWMREMLQDETRSGAILVATPEELPVSETIELARSLQDRTKTPLAGVVVNRLLPQPFTRDEEAIWQRIDHENLGAVLGGEARGILDVVDLARAWRASQVRHLATLERGVPAEVPRYLVPLSFGSADAPAVVSDVYEALSAEIDE